MSKEATPSKEPAPRRSDPDGTSLTAEPQSDLIPDQDPDFKYQWVLRSSLPRYMRPKTVGAKGRGFHRIPPWEIVQETPEMLKLMGRRMDAQGSPIDSALQQGQMVAIRLPWKYADLIDQDLAKLCGARERQLKKGEKRQDPTGTFQQAVTEADRLPAFMTGPSLGGL